MTILFVNKYDMKIKYNLKVNIIFPVVLLFLMLPLFAAPIDDFKMKIIPTAGCNLSIVDEISNNNYSLSITSGVHNFFAGVFEDLDTANPTTFSFDMTNEETFEDQGNVSKWDGLYPVYSYGNLSYDTYIYYTKNDDGYWVSSDPFAKDKLAGNGKTPVQGVIPAEFAEEFLSEDGNYWSAWQDIKDTKIMQGMNRFTITRQFSLPNAVLSMRAPFTYDYMFEYMKRLKETAVSGVTVHNIGKSIEDHDLYIVQISDPNATIEDLKDRRVILMYANEDGDEPDGCWVVNGAMNYLIQGIQNNDKEVSKILSEVTFLFLPMLDPVGWSNSTYAAITYGFSTNDYVYIRPEILSYARFIIDWISEKGNRLDVVVNLHNVECNEAPNVLCPILEGNQINEIEALNNYVLNKIEKLQPSIKLSRSYWIIGGFSSNRLAGWCSYFFGNIQMAYEINSRYPENRLSLGDLSILGKSFVISFTDYLDSDEYERVLPHIDKRLAGQLALYADLAHEYRDGDIMMQNYGILGRGF